MTSGKIVATAIVLVGLMLSLGTPTGASIIDSLKSKLFLTPIIPIRHYYMIGDTITQTWDLDPKDVGETDYKALQIKYAITKLVKETDPEVYIYSKLLTEINGWKGTTAYGWAGKIEDACRTFGGCKHLKAGEVRDPTSLSIDITVPTWGKYYVYTMLCEGGFTGVNEFLCKARKMEIIAMDENFCGNVSAYNAKAEGVIDTTWDNDCYRRGEGLAYCDETSHRCIKVCPCVDATQYCLAKYVETGEDLSDIITKMEEQREEKALGTIGCVDKDKVCAISADCYPGDKERMIGEHCEKQDIPEWLKIVNEGFTIEGKFGICKSGCKIKDDCDKTLGDPASFDTTVLGKTVPGISWTCLADGSCRLDVCRVDTDCWSIHRTQMAECLGGTCERITCTDHYDCWAKEVIPVGAPSSQYGYMCSAGYCVYSSEFASVAKDYLTPSLCEAAFGRPPANKAWSVEAGKCVEKDIFISECNPRATQEQIDEACLKTGKILPEGYKWICIPTAYGGTCGQQEIPPTEDCTIADNPDEYCMYREIVELPRGKKSICDEATKLCLMADATCKVDADCTIGRISGSCVYGLCDYTKAPIVPEAVCGNNECEIGETYMSCPEDCPIVPIRTCDNCWDWLLSKFAAKPFCTSKVIEYGIPIPMTRFTIPIFSASQDAFCPILIGIPIALLIIIVILYYLWSTGRWAPPTILAIERLRERIERLRR